MNLRAAGALLLLTAVAACASRDATIPTDQEILDRLPSSGPLDWPAGDEARVATERDRLEREAEAARTPEPEEDDEGLLGAIEAWSPGIEPGNSRSLFHPQDTDPGDEYDRNGEVVVAPVPFANPTIGGGLFLVGGYIFKVDPDDEVSPPSTVGAGAMYSTNNSWGLGFGGILHLDEDRWRIGAGLAYADIRYRLYGIGQELDGEGRSVRINQRVLGAQFSVLYGVGGSVHIGPIFRAFQIETELDGDRSIGDGPVGIPLKPVRKTQISLGGEVTRDTRDDHFYPRDGELIDLQARFYRKALGGDRDYQVYEFAFNTFHSLAEQTVLAGRAYCRWADGNVPFYALSYLGSLPDIRGYAVGRYQDKILLALQVEIRQELTKRLGVEAFAGFGQVQPAAREFQLSDFLPGLGAGVTYNVAPESHVNMRADVAWGVNGWVFYLGVGQAF